MFVNSAYLNDTLNYVVYDIFNFLNVNNKLYYIIRHILYILPFLFLYIVTSLIYNLH